MTTDPSEEELRETAAQLARPHGENGLKMAEAMNEINRTMIQHTIDLLDLREGDTVLELGPGNADHVKDLFSRTPDLEYHALEISETMLIEAQRRCASITGGKISISLYDGTTIPFPTDRFNRILTVNTIYFWQDPVKLLSEMHRVLVPGGKALITFGQKCSMEKLPFVKWGFKLYDDVAINALAQKAGFETPVITAQFDRIVTPDGESFDREFAIAVLTK